MKVLLDRSNDDFINSFGVTETLTDLKRREEAMSELPGFCPVNLVLFISFPILII